MRTAVIDGTQVVNVIEAQPGFELPGFLLVPTDTAGPGWSYVEGEFVPPPAPPQPVPQSVSRAQGKAALIQAGLWSAVVAYVDAMTDPTEKALAQVALNDTTEWLRTSPFLNAAATALGLTETQLDDLFLTAATIQL